MPAEMTENAWSDRLEGEVWRYVECEALPRFLRRQRWYAGKAREFDRLRLVDWAQPEGFPPSAVLTLVEVRFREGPADTYFVPLGWAAGDDAERVAREAPERVIARFDDGEPDRPGIVYDGLVDSAISWALLLAIEQQRAVATGQGEIRGIATTAYAGARGPADVAMEVVHKSVEQSNSVVLFGHRLLMKVFRRIEPGINPDFEIGKFLCETTAFDRIPAAAGTIEYHRDGAEPATLAILQALVHNQGTGWEHALRELAGYYPRCEGQALPAGSGELDGESYVALSRVAVPDEVRAVAGSYLDAAATLGRRTAELHRALASDGDHADFAPEPMGAADLAALQADIHGQFARTLDVLRAHVDRLGEAVRPPARRVLDEAPGLLAEVDALPELPLSATKIRCHGDYHLGQVLRVDDDFVILDFEGEPLRALDDRRKKQTPVKDLVGMLRSFDYAAAAALFAYAGGDAATFDRLAPWARLWQTWTSAAFLGEYRRVAAGAGFMPDDPAAERELLRAFTLEKALYELLYELNNRPDWVRIPLQGVVSLLG
jgi:maltose alpha-D-glucosyltransferase/alpha-amylase